MSFPEQHPEPSAPEPSAPERPAPEPVETVLGETTVRVRRSPRYFNFMLLGAIVGAILALILTLSFPQNPEFDQAQVFGFLLLATLTLGVTVGCVVALILDRVIGRKAETVVADRLGAHTPDVADTQDMTSGTQHPSEKSTD